MTMAPENIETARRVFDEVGVTGKSSRQSKAGQLRFELAPFAQIKWTATGEYLVKGVLPLVGLALIYGPPKCGKSFWAYDVAMHVARGLEYRGRRVRHGTVVYLAAEGGHGFKKRIEAYRQRNDCANAQFHLCTGRPDLAADHAKLIADIRAQIGACRPAAIFVDTVNRTLAGSENKPDDMAKYLRAAAALEDEFKCCVVLIHHCGIEAGRPRGHTSLTAAADVQISVERDAAENLVVTVELAKDGPSGEQFVSRLEQVEIGEDEDGEAATSCVVVPVEGQPQKKSSKKFSDQTELARRALAEVLCDRGESNISVPTGLKAVPREAWRDECYRRGIGGDTKEGRRKAFNRADGKLAVSGVIGTRDDFVWLANGDAS
jgi:hypothetical protein